MFKNRKFTLTVDKKDKDQITVTPDPMAFENKAEVILHKLESLGAKMFLGVCVFVLIDTYRQVKVEEAKNRND